MDHTSVEFRHVLMREGCQCPPLTPTAEGGERSQKDPKEDKPPSSFFNFQENAQLISCIPPQMITQMEMCCCRCCWWLSISGCQRSALINLTEISVSNRNFLRCDCDQTEMRVHAAVFWPLIGSAVWGVLLAGAPSGSYWKKISAI